MFKRYRTEERDGINMKKQIISFTLGALIFGTAGVFAGQYVATENPFPVQLNGENVSIEGYNINDSTYFKLRDIADVVGGFEVGFNNNTIQLSKGGYVYDNPISQPAISAEAEALKQYAQDNLFSIHQEDLDVWFNNVRFKLADISGDDVPELLAVGLDSDGNLSYIEIYYYDNGNIVRIINDHCQGYGGGMVYPITLNGRVYMCGESYSSSTGFFKNVIEYKNGEWTTAYSSYTDFNHYEGTIDGYVVNEERVSEAEYDEFNNRIYAGKLTAGDFVGIDSL